MDAFVSGRAGVAIIVDGDRLLSMNLEPHTPPIPCTFRDVRFLLGDARDLLLVEHETFDEIRADLAVARNQDDALQLALFTLDAELSDETREEAARALEELLASNMVLAFVEGVLLSHPAPKSADVIGAIRLADRAHAARAETFFGRVASLQPRVEEVWRAWEALPLSFFADEDERVRTRAGLVRAGVFRDFVNGDVDAIAAAARRVSSVGTVDNHGAILQALIRSLEDGSKRPERFLYGTQRVVASENLDHNRGLEARDEPSGDAQPSEWTPDLVSAALDREGPLQRKLALDVFKLLHRCAYRTLQSHRRRFDVASEAESMAQDLTLELFHRDGMILRGWQPTRGRTTLSSYLYFIGQRHFIHRLRRDQLKQSEVVAITENHAEIAVSDEAEEQVAAELRKDLALQAVRAQLDAGERELLELVLQGRSAKEGAAALGINSNSFRQRKAHLLRKLKVIPDQRDE
jgi:RNA polymerase sigma factor (sigma-70 family)